MVGMFEYMQWFLTKTNSNGENQTMPVMKKYSLHTLQQLHTMAMFLLFLSNVLFSFAYDLYLPLSSQTTMIKGTNCF